MRGTLPYPPLHTHVTAPTTQPLPTPSFLHTLHPPDYTHGTHTHHPHTQHTHSTHTHTSPAHTLPSLSLPSPAQQGVQAVPGPASVAPHAPHHMLPQLAQLVPTQAARHGHRHHGLLRGNTHACGGAHTSGFGFVCGAGGGRASGVPKQALRRAEWARRDLGVGRGEGG